MVKIARDNRSMRRTLLDDSTDNFRTNSLFETIFAKITGGII